MYRCTLTLMLEMIAVDEFNAKSLLLFSNSSENAGIVSLRGESFRVRSH